MDVRGERDQDKGSEAKPLVSQACLGAAEPRAIKAVASGMGRRGVGRSKWEEHNRELRSRQVQDGIQQSLTV